MEPRFASADQQEEGVLCAALLLQMELEPRCPISTECPARACPE